MPRMTRSPGEAESNVECTAITTDPREGRESIIGDLIGSTARGSREGYNIQGHTALGRSTEMQARGKIAVPRVSTSLGVSI